LLTSNSEQLSAPHGTELFSGAANKSLRRSNVGCASPPHSIRLEDGCISCDLVICTHTMTKNHNNFFTHWEQQARWSRLPPAFELS